jgi:tetratricopeptide (TPR) repeat protein
MSTTEAHSKVAHTATALEIDPGLSQPHPALASVHERSFRWADAEKEFLLPIKLNPNNASAHHWYALNLTFKRSENAMQEWRKAKELDPLSPLIGAVFGHDLVWSGHVEEGLEMLRSVVEMNDGFATGHRNLAYAYMLLGMNDEAVGEAKKILSLSAETRDAAAATSAFAYAGLKEEAVAILDRLLKKSKIEYIDFAIIAEIYAALHDEANSLEWLEKAVIQKSAGLPYTMISPMFTFLRDKPGFRDIRRKIGLQ